MRFYIGENGLRILARSPDISHITGPEGSVNQRKCNIRQSCARITVKFGIAGVVMSDYPPFLDGFRF